MNACDILRGCFVGLIVDVERAVVCARACCAAAAPTRTPLTVRMRAAWLYSWVWAALRATWLYGGTWAAPWAAWLQGGAWAAPSRRRMGRHPVAGPV